MELSAKNIRRSVLEHSKRANVGHIGSCLCIAEILAVLYRDVLEISHPDDPLRDRFILSKGHAALALYSALSLRGTLSSELLNSFGRDGSPLTYHPEHALPGIDFSTGSLGQGLSFAVGVALSAKIHEENYRAYALLSDGELNEGAVWEAAMFAAHHKLSNLIAVVDLNGQQALGYTDEVLSLSPIKNRWEAFGWEALEVDGHNEEELREALNRRTVKSSPKNSSNAPLVVLCHTIFGKGVSFMERKIEWHYLPMNDDQYAQALKEVG